MGSKTFLFLGLLLVTVLLISSEVAAARDLAKTSTNQKKTNEYSYGGSSPDSPFPGTYPGFLPPYPPGH